MGGGGPAFHARDRGATEMPGAGESIPRQSTRPAGNYTGRLGTECDASCRRPPQRGPADFFAAATR